MKLEINLADREEIAAAVPLLQLILEGTARPAPSLPAEFVAAQAADTRAPITGQEDPAAIFGGGSPLAPSIPPAPVVSIVVPPPPANTATTTTTPGPVSSGAVAGSVELDSKGLPWDGRIHAGSKAKVKDGSWRMKKELEAAFVSQVEAELRAAMGNAAPLVVPTVTTQAPAAPVGVVLPIITASVPAAPVADPTTFEQLMPRITAAVTSGLMPPTAVGAACAANGVASVVTLQQAPQFVPLVWATLKQQYPALGQ